MHEPTRDRQNQAVCIAVNNDRASIYMDHFVHVLVNCQFTAQFPLVATALLPILDANEHLRSIAVAIGALDASRRAQVGTHHPLHPSARVVAFTNYQRALARLQGELDSSQAPLRDDVLWTTFLLGLFELMSEPSGDRWARHMLYGTGKLLQFADMSCKPSPLKQMLFDAFQVLEANRAIMYGVDTFLSEHRWEVMRRTLFLSTRQGGDLPMDEMTSLMIYTASFSKRFFDQIDQIPESERHTHPSIKRLGLEGIGVQHMLERWYSQHDTTINARHASNESQLALLYYHTLLLFLSRNYTYYPCWSAKATPSLDPSAIVRHTKSISALIDALLRSSYVPGVMLLFSLRVVGSLADETDLRSRLLTQLDTIYWKGYVVAERVKVDLNELWALNNTHPVC
ncbi:hypothetical protein NOR_04351 [Metarhizium rileyi]|uniref:C6 finger domain protein n=1 Tax=Metarhizium rileyi (strain RCEF 4871) TaxID=1649241 RepID=A0A167EEB9_METRR|nr:hypothetical protein NOR_04351 [Metarhizium rileyi RCEF 4871]